MAGHGEDGHDELKEFVNQALKNLEMRQDKAMEERTQTLLAAIAQCRESPSVRPSRRVSTPSRNVSSPSIERPSVGTGLDRMMGRSRSDDDEPVAEARAPAGGHDNAAQECHDEAKDAELGQPERFRWQWQSSLGPWKAYEDTANFRLEKAYRRGESRVRLKSGIDGKVPMEIFFVDMVQRDPDSKRVRSIRRAGVPLSSWEKAMRHLKVIYRYLSIGQIPYESLQAYLDRQSRLVHLHVFDEADESMSVRASSVTANSEGAADYRRGLSLHAVGLTRRWYLLHRRCKKLVRSQIFSFASMFVILLQIWWTWYSTDMNYKLNLYDQDGMSVIIEHLFCIYFIIEFAINILALRFPRLWYDNAWLRLDFVCVASSTADVFVFPLISAGLDYDVTTEASGGTALRVLRLVKLFRIGRLFGNFHEFNTVIKGMLRGMRAAGFILVLLAIAIFVFGVLMRTNSDHESLQTYFGTLHESMITLLTHGLFLDGVADLVNDMFDAGLIVPIVFYAIFMYISFFGLLSMLIGAFCSVAGEVHLEEQEAKKLKELRSSLEEIAECYMTDGRAVLNQKQFKLLMENPDVHALLERSRTDVTGLLNITTAWFRSSGVELKFSDLLELIVHLRQGKAAVVSDVAGLQGYVLKRFDILEELLASAQQILQQLSAPPTPL